ncbi:MAG: hypothetical protein JW746_05130 [Candidatus Krumholzibacteriota bacterium]|nr:hypothetical protein [Candidatus Krumholzibacteriota bacterium]
MKRMITGIAGLTLVSLILFPVLAEEAEAQVRFDLSVKTPNISMRVGNGSYRHARIHTTRPRPVRIDRLVREDLQIAIRLAKYSGVRKNKLIRLRRSGYRWAEIARIYNIPARVVHAAMNPNGWNRFLEGEMRIGRRGHRDSRRVVLSRGR